MSQFLLMPPVVFIIIFVSVWIIARLASSLSYHAKKTVAGMGESYACGEDNYDPESRPDYSSFFPFAFFFTLAHVATLIMTTVPTGSIATLFLAAIYITGAAIGLYILFRR